MGTKVFYESLKNLQGIQVFRNFKPLSKPDDDRPAFFYLGVKAESVADLHEEIVENFEAQMQKGGRLVLSFFPVTAKQHSLVSEK